jgi:hypothetical protein
MLVIISDLHMTDGTSGPSLDGGVFQLFTERLHDLALRASWRTDGSYRPIEQLDLLLLGDVFDLVNSNRWLQSSVRPWHDTASPPFIETVSTIVDDIVTHNRTAISALRAIAMDDIVQLPQASRAGEPVYDSEPQPISVRTFYMVGNQDWPLHLPGPRYDVIRQRVAHRLGLTSVHNAPFPHDPHESDELLAVLRRHRVLARHGDVFDPLNFAEDRDCSSLGDALQIELVNRFVLAVSEHVGSELPQDVAAGLMDISHVRPLLLIPVWLEALLERSTLRPATRKQIKRLWDRLAEDFLQLPMVREQSACSPFDLKDGLERALKFSKHVSLGWAEKITAWLHSLRGSDVDSYCQHALLEPDYRNRRARHIVYGHTHAAETQPLDASYADGFVLNQAYFNAGTWRRVYRQTRWSAGRHEFVPHQVMTYLAFFLNDERSGRSFETWSGSLAVESQPLAAFRVDADKAHRVSEPMVAEATKPPLRPPHFSQSAAALRRPGSQRRGA